MSPLLAAGVSAAAAALAWRARALTAPGAAAAALVGGAILWAAGWPGAAALAAFFVTATLVSRLEPAPGTALLDPKGGRRDARQVLANGGAAAAAALVAAASSERTLAAWVATASLAAAAADTWATGIGGRSATAPRHILTGRPVPAGTSGGVSVAGTAGALGGAGVTALAAAAAGGGAALVPAGVMIGVAGMLIDSALGASLQGRFECPACGGPSEWRRHRCGATTVWRGGIPWLTNDGVNAAATGMAALAGALAWWLASS